MPLSIWGCIYLILRGGTSFQQDICWLTAWQESTACILAAIVKRAEAYDFSLALCLTHTHIVRALKSIFLCLCVCYQFDSAVVKLNPTDSRPLFLSPTIQKSIIQPSLFYPTASPTTGRMCSLFSNSIFSHFLSLLSHQVNPGLPSHWH